MAHTQTRTERQEGYLAGLRTALRLAVTHPFTFEKIQQEIAEFERATDPATIAPGKHYTLSCAMRGCTTTTTVDAPDLSSAYRWAVVNGWGVNEHARGAWTYCPGHADQYAGKTPSGRPLSGF